MRVARVFVLALPFVLGIAAARADDDPVDALIEGVREIAAPGVPGPICVFGPDAFAAVVAKNGEAVVAGTPYDNGRIIAFGHNGYFGKAALETKDTGRLLVNALRWAASSPRPKVGVMGYPQARAWLEANDVKARSLEGPRWHRDLRDVDVLIAADKAFRSDGGQKAVETFLKRGGGLITTGLAWGWQQLNPGKDLLTEHPINPWLLETGLCFADGYHSKTTSAGYKVDGEHLELANATRALSALEDQANGRMIHKRDVAQAAEVLVKAAQTLPPDTPGVMPALRDWATRRRGQIVPTKSKPLSSANALDRVLLSLEIGDWKKRAPTKVEAHPAAAEFPGAVPADAPRETRRIRTRVYQGAPREGPYSAANAPIWYSTGLYAPPGEAVTVHLDPYATPDVVGVRIGAHTDRIYHKKSWTRAPEISMWRRLPHGPTKFTSPFGGLIYITLPAHAPQVPLQFTISGAVDAPRFVAGVTTDEEWKLQRAHPGPWAELESENLILTLPSEAIRELDDPGRVMAFWDNVMNSCADLCVRPKERKAPERICADVQISNGYMHSGYPIMTHLDVIHTMVDVDKLKKGSWGFFHEIGHNHQSGEWTFGGTTEVTVNLFSLYIYDKVCGIPPKTARKNVPIPADKLKAYVESGTFEQWKKDPWLALTMYWQLQQAFGWEAFQKVFEEYRSLFEGDLPKTDAAKRDQWLVRMSTTVGKNLGPFFQAWRIPISTEARERVSHLPVWMPEGFPPK